MTTTTEAGEEDAAEGTPERPPFRDPAWWGMLARTGFGAGFWGFFAFAIAAGVACYAVIGHAAFIGALWADVGLLVRMAPRIAAALMVAGLLWVMLPRDRVTALIGAESGMRGLVIAAFAGMVTPGGPSSAFALLAVLAGSGADRGALIAYISSWAILGLQRVLVWDVPFMGAEFSVLRIVVCLPLPIIAGHIARRLPLTVRFADAGRETGR
jgi:uncharacterized membrane protein YraQ (UPF0718 family)